MTAAHPLDADCMRLLGTTVADAAECARTATPRDPVALCCDHAAATEWGRADRAVRIAVADAIDAQLAQAGSSVRVRRECPGGRRTRGVQ